MTERKILTNVRITPLQRAIFQKLGGVKWLRQVLDREAKKMARAEKKCLTL